MTNDKQKKPTTLEEALNQRAMEQVPDEQTQDEIVTQALAEASAQQRLGQIIPQEIPPNMRSKLRKEVGKMGLPAEMVTMSGSAQSSSPEPGTIPVSSTDPQPAKEDCIPASLESPTTKLIINTDAAMIKNPGEAAIACIFRNEYGDIIHTINQKVGEATNNQAEYIGVIEALRFAKRFGATDVEIRTDSELVVKQCKGEYRVNDPTLMEMRDQVTWLLGNFENSKLSYIPREQNKEADELAGQTIRGVQGWIRGEFQQKEKLTEADIIGYIEGDQNLRRLKEFVDGPEFTEDWVRIHIGHISRIPTAIPSPTLWEGIGYDHVVKMVYMMVKTPGYVENVWPGLSIVMGTSGDNTRWTAGVLTTLALFDTIHTLPAEQK